MTHHHHYGIDDCVSKAFFKDLADKPMRQPEVKIPERKFEETEEYLRRLSPGATPIALVLHGSHLYGTTIPTSDRDFKLIYMPSAEHILLQRCESGEFSDSGKRKTKNEQHSECEAWSLLKFVTLLSQSQTNAVEMIFAPDSHVEVFDEKLWSKLKELSTKLISKNLNAFLGYCKSQSAKYGRKGRRYQIFYAITAILLEKEQAHSRLSTIQGTILADLRTELEKVSYVMQDDDVTFTDSHINVLGHQCPLTASISYAAEMYEAVAVSYGERAKKAASTNGADWKAVSHALRIANEAIELFTTGNLLFPRPDKVVLWQIRVGDMPMLECEKLIDNAIACAEIAKEQTKLRDSPDLEARDQFILQAFRRQIEAKNEI